MQLTDTLGNAAKEYLETNDLRTFLDRSSAWILQYAQRRLHRDPDVIGDFYLHFYERAGLCMERYREYQGGPFTGFLAVYLRHEFYNFIRYRRIREVREITTDEFFSLEQQDESVDRPVVERLHQSLHTLSPSDRLLLKLYHGLELDAADLKQLCRQSGAGHAAEILAEYRRRRERARNKRRELEDKSRYIDHLIHSRDRVEADPRLRSWKRRLERRMDNEPGVFSLSEIAGLFSISKSTASRRLGRAAERIKEKIQCA